MDPAIFLSNLSSNISSLTRKKLLSQCFTCCIGKSCNVDLPKSEKISGMLEKINSFGEFSLKHNWRNVSLKFSEIVSMNVRTYKKKFKTDSEISKQTKAPRKLEHWNTEGPDIHLDHEDRNWNQFETNKKKFGVVSTYDEELYTTKKVSESQLSKEQVKRAIKIEKELANKERKDSEAEEDEEKMFGAVIGTGRYVQDKPEHFAPMRERATSMASCGEFTKDEYKKTREQLMNPHKVKKDAQIDLLEALDLTISQPYNEEIILNFIKFKQEKQPTRDSIMKDLKDFSNKCKLSTKNKLDIIEEEKANFLPKSVIDIYLESWKGVIRDHGFQEW